MEVGQGFINPCSGAVVARWFPQMEKSSVSAIYTGGNQISSILTMPLSSLLCSHAEWLPHFAGWPSIFYVPGTARLSSPPQRSHFFPHPLQRLSHSSSCCSSTGWPRTPRRRISA